MQATVVARGGTMSDGPPRKSVLSDGSGGANQPQQQPPASMMGKWFALANPSEPTTDSEPSVSEPAGG